MDWLKVSGQGDFVFIVLLAPYETPLLYLITSPLINPSSVFPLYTLKYSHHLYCSPFLLCYHSTAMEIAVGHHGFVTCTLNWFCVIII